MNATTRAIALALIAAPATAQDVKTWGSTYAGAENSTAQLHAPTVPDAVASFTFKNTTVHNGDEVFTLTWEGIALEVWFTWNAGGSDAETVSLLAPPGYIAVPDFLSVHEDTSAVAHIFEYRGN